MPGFYSNSSGYSSPAGGALSDESIWTAIIALIVFGIVLTTWALFILIKRRFIRELIRRKMGWSNSRDAFWDYDYVIDQAKKTYIKAQLFLNRPGYERLPLNPNTRSTLHLLKKKIKSEEDLIFSNVFIVSFIDKKDNENDKVKVYMEIRNKHTRRQYKEVISFNRNGDFLTISTVLRNPTLFILTHNRSIIEK